MEHDPPQEYVSLAATRPSEEAPLDPRVGQVIQERYRIVRLLGEGGMGTVYEGVHLLIGRRVAIKLLHPELARHPDVVQRFQNEAIAATSIGHPHIVEVTDMGRLDDGAFFMVLEYLEGCDLDGLLEREGPMTIARTVHVLTQVCDALEAAHRKSIVHRDLKPENIYLIERGDERDFVKLLDFGIAKLMGQSDHSLTKTGHTLGTPYFMAPEQARGAKSVDHRVDIYALGVILFRCLTAQFPFDDESFPMLVVKICNEPPPPLRAYRPDVPEEIVLAYERMLAKDPADRFSSVAEVKAALLPFAEFDAPPVVASDAPPPRSLKATRPLRQPQREEGETSASLPTLAKGPVLLAAFAAVALIAAIVLAFVLGETSETSETSTSRMEAIVSRPTPPAMNPEATPTVRLRIQANPTEAELRLDGEPVPNPFDAELPSTERLRHIEARLDGYRSESRDVPGGVAQRLQIDLEPSRLPNPPVARGMRRNRRSEAVTSGAESAVPHEGAAPAGTQPVTGPDEAQGEQATEPQRARGDDNQTEILPVRF